VTKEIIKFLNNNAVGVLATISPDGIPQAATVFFVTDDQGGLVFKSRSASDHMVSLKRNPAAALAVYDHNSNYKDKAGVQLRGTVSPITDVREMQDYVKKYGNTFTGSLEKFDPVETLVAIDASSTLFRFQITSFKFTDSQQGRADTEYKDWST